MGQIIVKDKFADNLILFKVIKFLLYTTDDFLAGQFEYSELLISIHR